MKKNRIDERLSLFINEFQTMTPDDTMIKPGEYNSLTTGIKRIQFRFSKANTPAKYVDTFELVNRLVQRFPLKSAIIWKAVSDAYSARFAGVGGGMSAAPSTTTEEDEF